MLLYNPTTAAVHVLTDCLIHRASYEARDLVVLDDKTRYCSMLTLPASNPENTASWCSHRRTSTKHFEGQ